MKTIKVVLGAFALLVMISFSYAQSTDKAANKTANKERTEKIIKHLELSDNQAVKAREINEKYFDLITSAKDANEKKRLTGEADAEAKKLLTEDQYKKYRAYLTAEKNPQQGKSAARIPTPPRTAN